MAKTKKTYDSISPTAISVAFARTFSDIPYSREIYKILEMEKMNTKSMAEMTPGGFRIPPRRIPMIEARYKATNKLLQKTGIKNILEIASGLSPRGLVMTNDKSFNFVELDLPAILKDKEKLIKTILGKNGSQRKNLHLFPANALDKKKIIKAAEFFTSGPIAIVCEGLLRYLTRAENRQLTKNIHKILSLRGGVWITPDIQTKKDMRIRKESKNNARAVSKITKTDIYKNAFLDKEDAFLFFRALGFSIRAYNPLKIAGKLVSPKKLRLTNKEVKKENSERTIVMLSIKK